MELNITYRHLESSENIKNKIETKVGKLKKYFGGKIYVDWVCSYEASEHSVEANIKHDAFLINASASDENLYKAIDLVIDKLEKQIQKKKDLLKSRIHKK